jgi:hypothetical protein
MEVTATATATSINVMAGRDCESFATAWSWNSITIL